MTIRPGQSWGGPGGEPADVEVRGGDDALADALAATPPGARVAFRPDGRSDLARALGLSPGAAGAGVDVSVDVLALG
ncbi:MAG: hypothetical protein ACRDWD_00965, partial [Acidimicrobiia bacterium]